MPLRALPGDSVAAAQREAAEAAEFGKVPAEGLNACLKTMI